MDIKNVNNIAQVANNTRLFLMSLDAYMSRLDLLRNSVELVDTNYSYNNELSGWVYYDTTALSAYHVFRVALPDGFVANDYNTMYYSLYNMPNLLVYSLGELTTPEDYGSAESELPFWWGYDASYLYVYVPTDGAMEDKYSFWLPVNYTDEEYNIFFNRAHTFYIDYRI
ncbi:MAG: hypothetical protein WC262_12350 [Bacteroidales bacterium]|jgi:hypothetical protein